MKKKSLLFLVLFLVVGFAAVTTTLYINGNVSIIKNTDDFRVYFSDALVNGTQDMSVVTSVTKISFKTTLDKLGQKYVLDYDVTNASKNYDADLEMSCTVGNEYLSVVNVFDDETILNARDTRSGKLTIELIKSNAGSDIEVIIDCTIDASAVERNVLVEDEVPNPVAPGRKYPYGREITLLGEKFNVIAEDDENVTMLAQYNINSHYRQTQDNFYVKFAINYFWPSPTGPMELDVQQYAEITRDYVNGYENYFNSNLGEGSVEIDLITLQHLKELECVISEDYTRADNIARCDGSPYSNWLINGQEWWTRSSSPTYVRYVWTVGMNGYLYTQFFSNTYGVRPILTISKELLEEYI